MNSKPVLAVLVSGLLGLAVGCGPPGPEDIKLTAPPGAISPQISDKDKAHRLTYTTAQGDVARAHAVEELSAQGLTRCENAKDIGWSPYVLERDGKRIDTHRLQEFMFLRLPPRVAMIELVHVPDGVAVTVEVTEAAAGNADSQRGRFCSLIAKPVWPMH